MENSKLVAPDGTGLEDRLRSLVDRTAEDIKLCSNSCDAYMKKKLLAKVLQGSNWNTKFLEFVELFAERRRDFVLELSIHTTQGIDKVNAKLGTIGDKIHVLDEKFSFPYFLPGGELNSDIGWTSSLPCFSS